MHAPVVQLAVASHHQAKFEYVFTPFAILRANNGPERGIIEQCRQRARIRARVAWRNDKTTIRLSYHLFHVADIRAYNRKAACHRFKDGNRHLFAMGRQAENVEPPDGRRWIGVVPQQGYPTSQPRRAYLFFKRRPFRSFTHNLHDNLALRQPCKG
ncbi:MAG: hypothetical protein FWG53_07055, partial [Clostridiales bacterium]|nr:hypothetical protein [Clostridiales bacterium]